MPLVPAASTPTMVDLDDGSVRVLRSTAEEGRASRRTPLLLIHGGGTDNAGISWFHAFEEFGADRRVLAPDLPGFGETTGIGAVGGPEAMADLVGRVADRLNLSRAVVVGVSMGGDVALNLALRRPDLVEGLVLVAPGGLVSMVGNRVVQFCAWAAAQLPDPVLFGLARLGARFVRAAIRRVVADPDVLPSAVVDEFVREAGRPLAFVGYARYNQATVGPRSMHNNLQPVVARISAPALFFHGADDPMVPPAGSRRATEAMPDARLVLVPGCGHWAQLEAPDRFSAEVRAFLAEVERVDGLDR